MRVSAVYLREEASKNYLALATINCCLQMDSPSIKQTVHVQHQKY